MTGHHGTPPKPFNAALDDAFEPVDQQAALDFVGDVADLLIPGQPIFPDLEVDAAREASWWLAGFAILCDWIGSNRAYFPYVDYPLPLAEYWKIACRQADNAIAETELLPKPVSTSIGVQHLIRTSEPIDPTPLQALSSEIALVNGPQLFILEDATGAGKTEAALLLAQRLMSAGRAHGLYFGLPTMATANAMYQRLGSQGYRQLFGSDSDPSLILAHGAAALSGEFRQSIVLPETCSDGEYEGRPAAAAHCNHWLADNRKKALLADVGIGTLDQALLAILPSRHQSLRLLGLIGKVLIIDEVHACDAYMHQLLCRLLSAHAAAGGSAILLSATLPKAQRQALTNAFAIALKLPEQLLTSSDYPLLTQVGDHVPNEEPVASRESVCREVRIDCLESDQAVEAVIEGTIRNDQCVCWIRNSVVDAREAYIHLRRRHPDWQVDLFHARFALADRLDKEQRVLDSFGKKSRQEDRKGRLLIATQVVEQSLDIDFDHMISDLAPIDLLIQRAGRLRRHRRDIGGNPIDGPDQRGTPLLYVHAPKWHDDPQDDWLENAFPRAAKVYPNHGQLWLGLKRLRKQGGFRMPEDARSLIEGVYGPDADIPEGLEARTWDAEGEARAKQSQAMLNELKFELGYNDGATNRWWDDTMTPTRLGDPTVTVWLARWEEGQLKPWRDDLRFAWQQSSLSLPSNWITEPVATERIPQAAIDECLAKLPAEGKWGVLLPTTEEKNGVWLGYARTASDRILIFKYQLDNGLERASGRENFPPAKESP